MLKVTQPVSGELIIDIEPILFITMLLREGEGMSRERQ